MQDDKNHWRWPFILQGTSLQHFNPLFSSIFWSNYSAKMFPPKIYRESRHTFIVEHSLSLLFFLSPPSLFLYLPSSLFFYLSLYFYLFIYISLYFYLFISLSISTSLSLSFYLSTLKFVLSFFCFLSLRMIWQQVPSPFRISFKCTLTNLKQLTPVLNL